MTSKITRSPRATKLLRIRDTLQWFGAAFMLTAIAAAVLTNTGTLVLDPTMILIAIAVAALILFTSIGFSIASDRTVKSDLLLEKSAHEGNPAALITEPQGE